MIRLIGFELRKSVLYRGVLLALALGVVCNLAFLVFDSQAGGTRTGWDMDDLLLSPFSAEERLLRYVQSLHQTYDGPITVEKVQESIQTEQAFEATLETGLYSTEYDAERETGYFFGDYYYFNCCIYQPLQYAATYADRIAETLAEAEGQCAFYADVGNPAQMSYWEQIIAAYQGRSISDFYDVQGWRYLFEYQFSDLIILLLLLLSQISSGAQEQETGMAALIASNPNGRRALYLAKPLAALLWTAGLTLLFALLNLWGVDTIYGLSGAGQPLYALSCYESTLLNVSMAEFYLLLTGGRILAFSVAAMAVCILSRGAGRTVLAFCGSLFFSVLSLWLRGFALAETPWKQLLALLSPLTLLRSPEIAQSTQGVFLGGVFCPAASACTLVQTGLLCLLALVNFCQIRFHPQRRLHCVFTSSAEN